MSFFTTLPYDIRVVIYSFIPLPPLSYTNSNFLLTCRLAYQELSDAAIYQTTTLLKAVTHNYAAETGYTIEIPESIHGATDYLGLRNVTINMPYSMVPNSSHGSRRKTTDPWHCFYPIFTACFDKMRIFIHWDGKSGQSRIRAHRRLEGLAACIDTMLESVEDRLSKTELDVEEKKPRLKGLVMAWDLRDVGMGFGEECKLKGKRYEFQRPEFDFYFLAHYELGNEEEGVGECRLLVSEERRLEMGESEALTWCWNKGVGREVIFEDVF